MKRGCEERRESDTSCTQPRSVHFLIHKLTTPFPAPLFSSPCADFKGPTDSLPVAVRWSRPHTSKRRLAPRPSHAFQSTVRGDQSLVVINTAVSKAELSWSGCGNQGENPRIDHTTPQQQYSRKGESRLAANCVRHNHCVLAGQR